MRQAAQVKLGYYPIPPSQMAKIAGRLHAPDPEHTTVLDPCCGEGDALKQLGELLGLPERNLHACELSDLRTERAKALMPDATFPALPDQEEGTKVFHGCAFSGLSCTYNSFSCVYLNPPFDDELGGGRREELTFLQLATNLLMTGSGVLVMVAPFKVFNQNRDVCRFLDCHYEEPVLCTFDFHERRFHEAVLFARKRKTVIAAETDEQKAMTLDMWRPQNWTRPIENGPEWTLPVPKHPVRRFDKNAFTPDELIAAIRGSKLNRLFLPPVDPPLKRPGMKLGPGHQALLVTAGFSRRRDPQGRRAPVRGAGDRDQGGVRPGDHRHRAREVDDGQDGDLREHGPVRPVRGPGREHVHVLELDQEGGRRRQQAAREGRRTGGWLGAVRRDSYMPADAAGLRELTGSQVKALWRMAKQPDLVHTLKTMRCITETADALVKARVAARVDGGWRLAIRRAALRAALTWLELYRGRTCATENIAVLTHPRLGDHYCRLKVYAASNACLELLPVKGFPLVNSIPMSADLAKGAIWTPGGYDLRWRWKFGTNADRSLLARHGFKLFAWGTDEEASRDGGKDGIEGQAPADAGPDRGPPAVRPGVDWQADGVGSGS
jgi:hypothetical protein